MFFIRDLYEGETERGGFEGWILVLEAALDDSLRKAAAYISQSSKMRLTKVTSVLALPAPKQERHAQSHVVFCKFSVVGRTSRLHILLAPR
jgi:hypothetical protein